MQINCSLNNSSVEPCEQQWCSVFSGGPSFTAPVAWGIAGGPLRAKAWGQRQAWMIRTIALLSLLLSFHASAQLRVSKPQPPPQARGPYHQPAASIPKECSDTRANPWLGAVCTHISRGRPQASNERLAIPAYGSAEAKRTGFSCIDGLAMRRLQNGWEQLRDGSGNFYRCTPL